MNDKEINKLIQEALRDERELPEGLSDRLEQRIDQWATDEEKRVISPSEKRRSLYWLGGIAASLLLGVVFFFQTENMRLATMADTYNNPNEAALAAEKALVLLSTQFNKGLDQVAEAGKEVDRVNTIINKQIESLSVEQ